MAYEIEIKAWLDDPDSVRRDLAAQSIGSRDYVKEDLYFRAPTGQEFRLRREEAGAVCTFKEKTIRAGVEVSREVEFSVSDPEAFEELVGRSGATVFARKKKTGSVFEWAQARVEVSHVHRLGDFVEIEKILEEDNAERHAEAEQEVRRILDRLGVAETAIEPRPYTALLADLERGAT